MKYKYLLLLLLSMLGFESFSQERNNSIGIGLGNIFMAKSIHQTNSKKMYFRTAFYNTPSTSVMEINNITIPTIYFSKRVFKNLAFRLNCSYHYRSFIDEYLNNEPIMNPDKLQYSDVHIVRSIFPTMGFQYDFKIGKMTFYPAVECYASADWYTYKYSYINTSAPTTIHTGKTTKNYFDYGINLLLGANYNLTTRLSMAYETGFMQENVAIISRLSLNCNF